MIMKMIMIMVTMKTMDNYYEDDDNCGDDEGDG